MSSKTAVDFPQGQIFWTFIFLQKKKPSRLRRIMAWRTLDISWIRACNRATKQLTYRDPNLVTFVDNFWPEWPQESLSGSATS